MPLDTLPPDQPLPVGKAFRHLVKFQVKLFVDALRDLLFSPISLTAFVLDALLRPDTKQSLSYKLMLMGRKSDRVINLFNEYSHDGDYTIDHTIEEVETMVQRELEKEKEKRRERDLANSQ